MDLRESLGLQPLQQAAQREPGAVLAAALVQQRVVAVGLDPVDRGGEDEVDAIALADREAGQRPSRRRAPGSSQQRAEPQSQLPLALEPQPLAGAVERGDQPLVLEGLEQVIQGVALEGADRVAIVGGDEDHRGHHVRAQRLDHLEAVQLGHLHVEEDHLGAEAPDEPDRRVALAALARHLDLRIVLEGDADAVPRQGLVVDDQHPDPVRQGASPRLDRAAGRGRARLPPARSQARGTPPRHRARRAAPACW